MSYIKRSEIFLLRSFNIWLTYGFRPFLNTANYSIRCVLLICAVEKETVMWTGDDRLVRGIRNTFLSDYVIEL